MGLDAHVLWSGLKGVDLANVHTALPGNWVKTPHAGLVMLAKLFTR